MADSARKFAGLWIGSLSIVAVTIGCSGCDGKPAPATTTQGNALAGNVETIATSRESPVALVEITQPSGIDFVYKNGRESEHHSILESLGGGVGVFDYDGDSQLDLFAAGGGRYTKEPAPVGVPSAMYRNLGAAKFVDVSALSGLDFAPHYTHGCAVGDFNSDGFRDILVTGYGGLVLFQNQGDGTFREIHESAGLLDELWSSSAGWGDLNGDGHLDLYVAHYVNWSFDNHPYCPGPKQELREICAPKVFDPLPHVVYYSNGDGTFRDATAEAGLRADGKGLGVLLADVDVDGDLDIYVANDTTDNFLYLNDGTGVFEEVGVLNGCALSDRGIPDGSMGVDLTDYNFDGRPDIWVANFEREAFALYQNDGDAMFLHVSHSTGITALGGLYVGFGTAFSDVDRDGDEDCLVANGHVINYPVSAPVLQLPLLLVHEENRFLRATFPEGSYFGSAHRGRGLALGDLDRDGDQDIVISNTNEPVAAIANGVENDNGWLAVRLIGVSSNRDAVGARLSLVGREKMQIRQIKGGGSYLSHSDLEAYWGVPKGDGPQELIVDWPSGKRSEVDLPELNRVLTLIEPSGPGDAS